MTRYLGSFVVCPLVVCLSLAFGLDAAQSQAFAGPKVVVSLKPVHSLVAGVMGDSAALGEPTLLIPGSASPHAYSMRPSDAKALSEADLVFWIGAGLETFLDRPLRSLARGSRVVKLSAAPGVELLESRAGGAWDAHDEAHDGHESAEASTAQYERDEHDERGDEGGDTAHGDGGHNLHIWLDPDNAVAIVRAAVAALSEADPGGAAAYAENGAALVDRLQALDRDLASDLAPVQDAPFVVFHDAYPYFERHYGLNAVGSIAVSPERTPGAGRLSEIRAKLRGLDAACVFSEPQFTPRVVDTVIEGSSARHGVLDPLGVDHPAGPDAYFLLMRGLAKSLRDCLAFGS